MSQLEYHSTSKAGKHTRLSITAGTSASESTIFANVETEFNYLLEPQTDTDTQATKPKPGTARGFRGRIHEIVPELQNLSPEDVEKIIDESDSENYD
jgi:predicted choloylglycine hydrolase